MGRRQRAHHAFRTRKLGTPWTPAKRMDEPPHHRNFWVPTCESLMIMDSCGSCLRWEMISCWHVRVNCTSNSFGVVVPRRANHSNFHTPYIPEKTIRKMKTELDHRHQAGNVITLKNTNRCTRNRDCSKMS